MLFNNQKGTTFFLELQEELYKSLKLIIVQRQYGYSQIVISSENIFKVTMEFLRFGSHIVL